MKKFTVEASCGGVITIEGIEAKDVFEAQAKAKKLIEESIIINFEGMESDYGANSVSCGECFFEQITFTTED